MSLTISPTTIQKEPFFVNCGGVLISCKKTGIDYPQFFTIHLFRF